ncbi:hypothetical protein [Allonocardiopsis opalescens]|uniref:Uncharacterized protein n=1 Tax=Allonocardiopsis opalescens TaxID=1144618 RepID=A0A2T0Q980_9ACTN|nr:hypothetical protein [Allonocardiopsis opalescens]PRY00405.1 hypothetical protein CLV72_10234 [Allonocardiopsis opalescens]
MGSTRRLRALFTAARVLTAALAAVFALAWVPVNAAAGSVSAPEAAAASAARSGAVGAEHARVEPPRAVAHLPRHREFSPLDPDGYPNSSTPGEQRRDLGDPAVEAAGARFGPDLSSAPALPAAAAPALPRAGAGPAQGRAPPALAA